ncbi:MAG: hypothetical protein P4N60_11555 [Verrucomicrobiae bacterium]|nr:hypothetical protein [Verrucomicrobiae bacterium]
MGTFLALMDWVTNISPSLFTANALVVVTCLIAGPRLWSRRLCLIFIWINTLIVLTVTADLICVLIGIVFHGYREETTFASGIILFPLLPLALEMIVFVAIYQWRLRDRATSR